MIGFWEQFILSLVPGILGAVLQALKAQGSLSPSVMGTIKAIDAALDALLVATGDEPPATTPANKAA